MKPPSCPRCKGEDTCRPDLARWKPSVFYALVIGWIYLLLRLALFPRSWTCTECGETFRQRTGAAYLALITLGLLVLLILLGIRVESPTR